MAGGAPPPCGGAREGRLTATGRQLAPWRRADARMRAACRGPTGWMVQWQRNRSGMQQVPRAAFSIEAGYKHRLQALATSRGYKQIFKSISDFDDWYVLK